MFSVPFLFKKSIKNNQLCLPCPSLSLRGGANLRFGGLRRKRSDSLLTWLRGRRILSNSLEDLAKKRKVSAELSQLPHIRARSLIGTRKGKPCNGNSIGLGIVAHSQI